MRNLSLRFGSTTVMTGFTGLDTASFNDLRPSRIIREVIQNSLDAAVEAGEKQSIVKFRISKIEKREVPDIEGYENHYRRARDYYVKNGELSDAAEKVVTDIEDALVLFSDEKQQSLSILDNGIGLDEKRMASLLGQGTSVKSVSASGSYGVGHLASIPASALRYVLYGGVQKTGQRIFSGCAVLASRSGKRRPFAATGYLVKGFGSGKDGKLYEFFNQKLMPEVLAANLDEISNQWGHGSVIVIPAFNFFGFKNQKTLWESVSNVTAYNFNTAVFQGNLVVEVEESGCLRRLDKNTLEDVLEVSKDKVRSARKGSFFDGLKPSGQSAYSTFLALNSGNRVCVETEIGSVDIGILVPAPFGKTRVDLFRNGMWITDSVYGLSRSEFTSQQPFHAVISLNANEGKFLHRLVRKAEGPMHDELAFSRLSSDETTVLKSALEFIADEIKKVVPDTGSEAYTPDDYLCVETGGNGIGEERFSMWGLPVAVQRPRTSQRLYGKHGSRNYHDDPERDKSEKMNERKRKRGKKEKSRSNPLPFRSTVVPAGNGLYIVAIECIESFDEVDLSFRVDENTDATCDRVWVEERIGIKSFEIDAEDGEIPECKIEDEGKVLRMSGLTNGVVYKLRVVNEYPEDLEKVVENPVLKIDLHKPISNAT